MSFEMVTDVDLPMTPLRGDVNKNTNEKEPWYFLTCLVLTFKKYNDVVETVVRRNARGQ